MSGALDLGGERRAIGAGSPEARSESGSRGVTQRRLAHVARFLLTWLAAFLMIIALFCALGRQLKAMSTPVRALLVSGVFVVVMNILVMPGLTRLLARFEDPATRSGSRCPQ